MYRLLILMLMTVLLIFNVRAPFIQLDICNHDIVYLRNIMVI